MGIQGLHKGLNFATQKTTIQDFRGKTLAVDASSWLHRSVYSVSEKYVEGIERGQIDQQSVRVSAKYVTSRCRELLQAFHIAQIFLVMDGKRCPLKADTNGERERKRQANLQEARRYKKQGRNDKAEEKYKCCIKIKDELTNQVMAEVKRSFQNDKRVHLIWSPYEADAQLAKLCVDGAADAVITEDSDVLVYSAAAHCAFPVIFKLDRQTGMCDVISMDWLLSSNDDQQQISSTTVAGKKPPSALESLLRNLASRQSRRPGFGVRLFVQGCVLAGCDYAPNKLSGVGLVNAFKYVRDNAFRNDSVRFTKVLDALPRKNKVNIDTAEYELNLAKSEAVFYYHIVRHQDRSTRPLCEPRTAEPERDSPHSLSHHFPLMERFGDDWSFLGDMTAEGEDLSNQAPPPIKEIAFLGRGDRKANPISGKDLKSKSTLPAMFAPKKMVAPAKNPYAKSEGSILATRKRPREDNSSNSNSRAPLDMIDVNNGRDTQPGRSDNCFAKFARTASREESHYQIRSFCDTIEEVRFVKRHFSSEKEPSRGIAPATLGGLSTGPYFEYDDPNIMAPTDGLRRSSDIGELRSTIDCFTSESLSDPSNDGFPAGTSDTKVQAPMFFDLTDSNSEPFRGNFDGVDDDDEEGCRRPPRVSLDESIDMRRKSTLTEDSAFDEDPAPSYDFQLPDASPPDEDPATFAPPLEPSTLAAPARRVPSQSKYFSGGNSITPRAKSSPLFLDADEIIDSPDDSGHCAPKHPGPRAAGIKSTRLDNTFRSRPSARTSTTISSRRPLQGGPLIDAFRKQKEKSPSGLPSQGQPWVRSFPPLGNRRPLSRNNKGAAKNTLDSYFGVKKQNNTVHE